MHTKSSRIEIRTDVQEKSIIEKAASLAGQTLSAYMLTQTLSAAKKDIAQLENVFIRNEDRELFYDLLLNPPEPNQKLIKLMSGVQS